MEKKWAGKPASKEQIQAWIDQFHRDGFLVLHDVLPQDMIAQLKADLDEALSGTQYADDAAIHLKHRMFETSAANLNLFDWEPIVSFAEALVSPDCHVIHNNSFRSPPGGGISGWHQDDPPHYLVTEGDAPKNVQLPVLWFTANYYLTDVDTVAHGPTQAVPGSHLFGKPCPSPVEGTEYEHLIASPVGKAGTVVMFDNQVWHRGGPNLTDRTRYITQVTYGRRLISHMYYPFMNYVMPEHVYKDADPRLKRLLGFKFSGAYG